MSSLCTIQNLQNPEKLTIYENLIKFIGKKLDCECIPSSKYLENDINIESIEDFKAKLDMVTKEIERVNKTICDEEDLSAGGSRKIRKTKKSTKPKTRKTKKSTKRKSKSRKH